MKSFLLLTVTFSVALATNGIAPTQQTGIILKNIQPQYRSLDEVKAILANESDKPIYLLPKECGEAQVLFGGKQLWEPSDYPECPDNVDPVEIKPGDTYQIPNLVIRFLVGEEKPLEEKKGSPGKFKIVMRYSLNPVYRKGPPQLKSLREISKEFSIVR